MDLFILHQQQARIFMKQEWALKLAGDVMVRSAILLDQVRREQRRVKRNDYAKTIDRRPTRQ